jgi:beta-galactosidase
MQLAIALLCCLVELVMSLAPMHLGVCYYPEQWNRSMWESDFQRMHSLGLSYVRLGEFSWSNVEPSPGGSYNWQWLDDVLLLAQQNQLGVVLGTPTATPPKWLMDKYRGQVHSSFFVCHVCEFPNI